MSAHSEPDTAKIDAVVVHLIALPAVIVIPPLVYDAFYHSSWASVPGLPFIGGVTYPAYALYCISRLRRPRLRFILAYLVGLLTVAFAVAFGTTRATPEAVFLLPTALGALPFPIALAAWLLRKRQLALNCLFCGLIGAPLGAWVTVMTLLGSAMSGMRW